MGFLNAIPAINYCYIFLIYRNSFAKSITLSRHPRPRAGAQGHMQHIAGVHGISAGKILMVALDPLFRGDDRPEEVMHSGNNRGLFNCCID